MLLRNPIAKHLFRFAVQLRTVQNKFYFTAMSTNCNSLYNILACESVESFISQWLWCNIKLRQHCYCNDQFFQGEIMSKLYICSQIVCGCLIMILCDNCTFIVPSANCSHKVWYCIQIVFKRFGCILQLNIYSCKACVILFLHHVLHLTFVSGWLMFLTHTGFALNVNDFISLLRH